MRGSKPILLLEDDEVDALTVKRAFKENNVPNRLVIVPDGEEGLNHLRTKEKPCIILSDIKMPIMNGIEFVREVKKDNDLKMIPVIILTASKEERDKIDSFKLSVAGYFLKPVDYKQFVQEMKTFQIYWSLSQLPL